MIVGAVGAKVVFPRYQRNESVFVFFKCGHDAGHIGHKFIAITLAFEEGNAKKMMGTKIDCFAHLC